MSFLLNIISRRLLNADFSRPLTYVDLFLALFFIVAFLVYLRRFPVFRVVVGTFFLFLCSIIFYISGFIFTALVFGFFSGLIIISLPLVFSPEIRHYMEKLGRLHFFFEIPSVSRKHKDSKFIKSLVDAIYILAEKKIGALIVLQRKTSLGDLIDSGIKIDAHFGLKLLETIFYPNTPLHDGAVVIVGNRIVAAKCIINVSRHVKLDPPFGLRHRAGISITQNTDAVSLIVSEQRGEVSLVENNRLESTLDQATLIEKLNKLL